MTLTKTPSQWHGVACYFERILQWIGAASWATLGTSGLHVRETQKRGLWKLQLNATLSKTNVPSHEEHAPGTDGCEHREAAVVQLTGTHVRSVLANTPRVAKVRTPTDVKAVKGPS